VICSNLNLTIHELKEEAGISKTMYHEILTENLGMHYVAAISVPLMLSEYQKRNHVDVSEELVNHANTDENFLKNIVTDDKNWLDCYDVETKAQPLQWVPKMSPRPKRAWQVQANVKVMLIVFFDCVGIIHHKFLRCGQTVNMEYYLNVMKRQKEAVRRKKF